MIGETIGHYRIIERLGAGGMGEVFLAEDLRLHRQAAIKIIAEQLTADEPRRLRFVQEARLAASIDHPNIAAIYDVDEDKGRTFIAMEYVPGQTLRHVLRAGPLEPARAVELALQIAGALAKVHERGVIHRDLKPDNVIVSRDGYAKIIDFGLAKLAEPPVALTGEVGRTTQHESPKTEEGAVLGTVPYMSPEQARGRPLDARSDIFSFGALFYEMLTAQSAFRRSTAIDTFGAVLREDPPAVTIRDASAMPDLRRILAKCLQKEASSRYRDMRAVEADLRRVQQLLDRPSEVARVAPLWLTSWVLLVGSAAVVLLVAGVLWLSGRGPAPAGAAHPVDRPAVAPLSSRPVIAIFTFDGADRNSVLGWLSKGLPVLLGTALGQTADLEIVTRSRLHDSARTSGRDSFDLVDPSDGAAVARQAGAKVLLRGGILQVGADLTIDTKGEDAATGRQLFVETVRGKDVLGLVDDLAARVRTRLGLGGGIRHLADVSSASVDAWHFYSDGLDALDRWRSGDAARMFERAAKIDGAFALAYLRWSISDEIDGKADALRQHLSTALEHGERLAERERLEAQARLAAAEARFGDALAAGQKLLTSYPDTERIYFAVGDVTSVPAGPLPDAAATAELFQRGVAALPASGALRQALGAALSNSGRFDDALRELESARRLRPKDAGAIETLADGQLAAGDPWTAIETYRRAVKAGSDAARTGLGWALASVGRYDEALDADRARGFTRAFLLSRVGRRREAETIIQSALKQADRDGDAEFGAALVTLDASLAFEAADDVSARRLVADATTRLGALPDPFRRRWLVLGDLIAGACEVRAGQLDAARARLSQRQKTVNESSSNERWWFHALEGEVALGARDGKQAAKSFAAALPAKLPFGRTGIALELSVLGNSLPFRDGPARALAAQGKVAEAIAWYRQLLTPSRESRSTGVLDPRHVLALARLLESAGQKDAARAEYRRFLDLWIRADPDLPELVEARKGAG